MQCRGADLVALASHMMRDWHPTMRTLVALTDPSTGFPVNIRTSVPIAPWTSSNVTLIGDAIHTMTPGRGVGANTALRYAALLCRNLIAVHEGRLALLAAVRDYETQMRDYAYAAVEKSREQMDGKELIHKPLIGRVVLKGMRAGMRLTNHLPPVKRRMTEGLSRERGGARAEPGATLATA
jgi:2-polyprenyl-6-methoxyphenol hydroxylase-like FAD-dependent oxidoreductase